ncbi:MAG: DNA polymerase IV 1, partial [Alphaproteobacteria bacterium MarineAlpha3_Bin1]
MFALVDVNNFYASCERLFEPRLEGVAVVVLSNNDGCIIARSQEAKDLGIPMGEPVHKVKDVLRRERVRVYSSNYALYGDLSGRVVSVLKRFTPYLEVYSIDESFLDLGGFTDPAAHSHDIKDTVLRWTGLPVSVGVGATKTLAKAANRIAKKDPALGGVFIMPDDPDEVLGNLNTDAIWGIGRRLAARLDRIGITTALGVQLRKDLPDHYVSNIPNATVYDFIVPNRPPFDDYRVRKALFLAFDRQAGIDLIEVGNGGIGVIMPCHLGGFCADELKDWPGYRYPKDQDIAEAKRLLAEA